MFCGCALVCTNIGGHQAYAKNGITALTVEPRTPQDMAEKLLMLLENPEYRVEMATRGNEFIQQFTWKAASEKMLRIFNEKL
jgi:glycosyltransferase involved in cell wall biosynthesis